ncbi:MAG: enoyl-CoA hydratase family protein, partial [Streptosporangiaceae bacterium]
MTDALLAYSADRGIARIALDSPRNRNALSAALMTQLEEALAAAAADDGVRAVELTHTGSTFCAGADLTEARAGGMARGTARLMGLLRQIIALPKPVVASIDGHVRAGGMGLVGACDIALAGPASTFAFSEVRLGLAPAIISLTTLPRLSPRAAGRYYLTGETFDAPAAASMGLITEAVADIDAGTLAVLDTLRKASPQGLAETKPLLTAGLLARFEADGEALVA